VVATTEAPPAASTAFADSDALSTALGALVDSVVVVSEPEQADRTRAPAARALRRAIFVGVMEPT
jgi:hypothetical protein